ncbi:glycoside hydrolase superfamily [Obelidium mucronatum]|nr:glycoside hydrolase superfamily [Obelidium mucronatum]
MQTTRQDAKPSLRPLIHMISRILPLVALFSSSHSFVDAAGPLADGQTNLIAYWGQNLNKQVASFKSSPEVSLADVCKNTKYNIIHIKGILSYYTVKGYPGVDFNNHCSFPLNVFHNWPIVSKNGLSLLDCATNVGKDITTCQAMGKKVVLVIDPLDFMNKTATLPNGANAVADNIWNLFLGGTSEFRPFGPNVVVDGIDLHIWSNNPDGVKDLAINLKTKMGSKYIFAASPRCQYPDYLFSPTAWGDLSPYFDYIITFFLATSNACGFNQNRKGFNLSLTDWSSYAGSLPLIVGLSAWPTNEVILAKPGDYIPVSDFQSQDLISQFTSLAPNFAGFSLLDVSFDMVNLPCKNDPPSKKPRYYSDFLYQQLTLPAGQRGDLTSGSYQCLNVTYVAPSPSPPSPSPAANNGGAKTTTTTTAAAAAGGGGSSAGTVDLNGNNAVNNGGQQPNQGGITAINNAQGTGKPTSDSVGRFAGLSWLLVFGMVLFL